MNIDRSFARPTSLPRWALAAGLALSVGNFGQAWAHHSFAMFDMNRSVTIKGAVQDFQWANPHVWIELTVMEAGQPVHYSVEAANINLLGRAGWTRKSLKPGDEITVDMHPLKEQMNGGALIRVVQADGHVLALGG